MIPLDPASVATLAAVPCDFSPVTLFLFPPQEILCYATVKEVPGKQFILSPFPVGIESWIDPAIRECLHPFIELKLIIPAIQFAAPFIGSFQHLSHTTVSP